MKKIALLVPLVLHGIGASMAVVLGIGVAVYIGDFVFSAATGEWIEFLMLAVAALFSIGVFATFVWSVLLYGQGRYVRSAQLSTGFALIALIGLSATYAVFARELEQGFIEAQDDFLQAAPSLKVPYGEDGRPLRAPLVEPQVTYQCEFLNGDVAGDVATTSNVFEYSLSDDEETMDFSLETIFFNYHTCELRGEARLDPYMSDETEKHYIFVEDSGLGYCVLDIFINEQKDLVLTDISPTHALDNGSGGWGCNQYCGARGSIGGTFYGSYLTATSTNASCIF